MTLHLPCYMISPPVDAWFGASTGGGGIKSSGYPRWRLSNIVYRAAHKLAEY